MRANCRATVAASTVVEVNACVHTLSTRRSAISIPIADAFPGKSGTSTRGIRSDRATAAAWSGPAPPNAKSANRRGSYPRSIDTILIALAMFSLAISTIDDASSTSVIPVASASGCSARVARSRSSVIRPPRK